MCWCTKSVLHSCQRYRKSRSASWGCVTGVSGLVGHLIMTFSAHAHPCGADDVIITAPPTLNKQLWLLDNPFRYVYINYLAHWHCGNSSVIIWFVSLCIPAELELQWISSSSEHGGERTVGVAWTFRPAHFPEVRVLLSTLPVYSSRYRHRNNLSIVISSITWS